MKFAAALLLLAASGCSTIRWTCDVPVVVTLRDTTTEVRCPAPERVITISHPKAVAP